MADDRKLLEIGNKVSLRLMTREDTDLIVKWRNNERVRANFVYREVFTPEIHEKWIKDKVETGEVVQFIICENGGDLHPVGSVYFRDIDSEKKTAEYGIFIGEDDAIGKGYGNETAQLAVKYAKEEMGLQELILRAFISNTASIKSSEHAGFVKCEDMPAVQCSDGQKGDMILMKLML